MVELVCDRALQYAYSMKYFLNKGKVHSGAQVLSP